MTRLPSGRHNLSREEVRDSQRGRLVEAVVRSVADKGYSATTVADVVERASVSRKTFYEQFSGMREAFLTAYDAGVEVILWRMAEAGKERDVSKWRDRLDSDLGTFFQVIAEEPAFAWSLHVEVLSAGPAALARRAQILDIFSKRTKELHVIAMKQEPGLRELPDEAFLLHTGGIDELVREVLRTRGAAAVPELTGPAVDSTLALFGARRR